MPIREQLHEKDISLVVQDAVDELTAELSRKSISDEFAKALENVLKPMAEQVCISVGEIEKLKRKEYLSPDEVEKLYGLRATTLANKRTRAQGPEYTKAGEKILYRHQDVKKYLDARRVRTES